MKQSLQLRLSQHLALTPQLQQSIRLLQLSTIELQQEVEQALTENPLLERENEWLDTSARIGADGSVNALQSNSATPLPTESPPPAPNGGDSSNSSDSSYENGHDNGADFDSDYGSD
ncbi:RNA polymerase factor sigma-54, partial [Escherichia coli]|nr:RNA polymerase factor sigma-54 [Escherichia coli]